MSSLIGQSTNNGKQTSVFRLTFQLEQLLLRKKSLQRKEKDIVEQEEKKKREMCLLKVLRKRHLPVSTVWRSKSHLTLTGSRTALTCQLQVMLTCCKPYLICVLDVSKEKGQTGYTNAPQP